jgi:hypothetical protein
MKKLILLTILLFGLTSAYSQTYKSPFLTKQKAEFETDYKARVITITDKEISVTNFLNGGRETLYLIVNKIENVNYYIAGLCKTYRCMTKTIDAISGESQKVIVYKTALQLTVAMFVDEVTIMKYIFSI